MATEILQRRPFGWREIIHEFAMKRKTIIEDLEGRVEALREFGFNPNDSIDDVKGKDAAYALGRRDELEYALKLLRGGRLMVTLFKEGMRVRFYPSHDGAHQLTGTIEKIHDEAPLADVMAEPDGKFVEVARLFTSNLSDLVPAEPEPNGEND